MFSLVVLAVFILFIFIFTYYKNAYSYWEKNGVHAIKPKFIFGNVSTDVIFFKMPPILLQKELYQKLAPHKVAGIYIMSKPELMIRDPEMIKNVLVKDFHYFYNRSLKVHPKIEPKAYSLAMMEDEEWRNTRIKFLKAFTSGKIKMMFPLVKICANDLHDFISQQSKEGNCIDVTDLCSKFSMDTIGSCIFGIETSCVKNLNSEFYKIAKKIFGHRFTSFVRFSFPNIPPTLIKIFKLKIVSSEIEDFFTSLIENTVHYREENNVKRNDFLNLLITLKNNTEITSDLMIAQTSIFFTDGAQGTAKTLNFAILEIAQNYDIQTKMREEILSILNKYNNEFCYDMLKELTYMDMVFSETLRKYPVSLVILRKCTENYKIPNTDTIIEKGTDVSIPIIGLHSDKQYYEYPDKFYPEHFTEEAKARRPQFAYIPFGGGPRVCIAERFAKMQMKVALFYLLKNYTFYLSPKMEPASLEFSNKLGLLSTKDNIWITFKNI